MIQEKKAFAGSVPLILALVCLGMPPRASGRGEPEPPPGAAERQVIDLMNQERARAQCGALKRHAKLMTTARQHALNMAKQEKLDHDLDGKGPDDRMKDAGYRFGAFAENIAWGQLTPEKAVATWMDSPPHQANLLNADYTEVGVGVAQNKRGEWYYVAIFARPGR